MSKRWTTRDTNGQVVTIRTDDRHVVLAGHCFDIETAEQVRLQLGAAIREARHADRHP